MRNESHLSRYASVAYMTHYIQPWFRRAATLLQRETQNDEKFDNAYTFLKLEEPSATNIRKLESFSCRWRL